MLKPGGRVAIIDIHHVREYAQVLERASMRDLARTGPNFIFVIPSYTLAATKPG